MPSAEEKKRSKLAEKFGIVETWMRNTWPDAYLMPRDAYVIHLSAVKSQLEALVKGIDGEIYRIKD
jgi:hypothetical protein